MMRYNKGYVLVIVLLILAVTTAAVVDFARIVYVYVNTANNFTESERLSLLLRSAYVFAVERARDLTSHFINDQREITFEEKIEDTKIGLLVEDNNSKFKVNLLGVINPVKSGTNYNIFKKLLQELRISEDYAGKLADFIDSDKNPTVPGGENKAKNYSLFSLSELSYIFPEDDLKTVMPYLTVFGDGKININTAELPLLKALHKDMTETLAKRIIEVREGKPFESTVDVTNVPGMKTIGVAISDVIKYKSDSFNVIIKAERNDLVETAEAGFVLSESGVATTKYWRER